MAEKKKYLEPLFANVILKRIDNQKKTTDGGIVIPDSVGQKTYECEVLEAGPDCLMVEDGDIVLIGKTDEITEVTTGQQTVLILAEEEILAKVSEK